MIEDKEKRSEKYNIQWKIVNTVKIEYENNIGEEKSTFLIY